MSKTITYEYVKNYIEQNEGYVLISEEYKNAKEDLIIKCPNNHIFTTYWNNFRSGKRCPICAGNKKHSGEFIYNEFLKHNYIPQFQPEDYKDNKQSLPYVCKHHVEQGVQYMCYHNFHKGRRCYYCALESRSGENHYDWKNGISQIKSYLSRIINEWKIDSMKICGYNCIVTGLKANSKFNVHHLYSMELIMDEVYNNLNIVKKKKVNEYNEFEIQKIYDECIELHKKYGLGVCIHPKIHKLFHITYGYRKSKPEQFKEFITRLQLGEFNNFLKENHLELNINYEILNQLLIRKEKII